MLHKRENIVMINLLHSVKTLAILESTMKKTFLIAFFLVIANLLTLKAQNASDIDIIGSFEDLKLYEYEFYDLNTGENTPFRITGQMPNVSVVISADKSSRTLDVFFTHNMQIKQLNRVTRIQTNANIGTVIFFTCTLDDNTEFSIQYQVYEGIAFISYQNMDVVTSKFRCKWDELSRLCNQWY